MGVVIAVVAVAALALIVGFCVGYDRGYRTGGLDEFTYMRKAGLIPPAVADRIRLRKEFEAAHFGGEPGVLDCTVCGNPECGRTVPDCGGGQPSLLAEPQRIELGNSYDPSRPSTSTSWTRGTR